jgi:hypothetical protein
VAALWRWRGAWCGSLPSRLDCKCRALILECSRVSFTASRRPIPSRLRALPLCCSPWPAGVLPACPPSRAARPRCGVALRVFLF